MLRTHTSAINTLIISEQLSRRVEDDIRALTLLAPSLDLKQACHLHYTTHSPSDPTE